jgi:hypothetical protein
MRVLRWWQRFSWHVREYLREAANRAGGHTPAPAEQAHPDDLDAVLVGGSAAALWANHRSSCDHDHVLQDLGELGDIESGVRSGSRSRASRSSWAR